MELAISDSVCQISSCVFERTVYRPSVALRHLLQAASYLCSSVSIATRYVLEGPGFETRRRRDFLNS